MSLNKLFFRYKYRVLIHTAKSMISQQRYTHSSRVATLSCKLAVRHSVNIEFAWLVGYLHDICREMDLEDIYTHALESRKIIKINLDEYFEDTQNPIILHGLAAVSVIDKIYPLNSEIYLAIISHTLGALKPNSLQKIIFVADVLEPQRRFWNQKERTKVLAEPSLDIQLLKVISVLEHKFGSLHPITEKMRDSIIKTR